MFQSMFLKYSIESFKCDICQLSKHNWTIFSWVLLKVLNHIILFIMMFVYQPPVSNILGGRWLVSFIDDCSRVIWIFMNKKNQNYHNYLFNIIIWCKQNLGRVLKECILKMVKNMSIIMFPSFPVNMISLKNSCVSTPHKKWCRRKENLSFTWSNLNSSLPNHVVMKFFWLLLI